MKRKVLPLLSILMVGLLTSCMGGNGPIPDGGNGHSDPGTKEPGKDPNKPGGGDNSEPLDTQPNENPWEDHPEGGGGEVLPPKPTPDPDPNPDKPGGGEGGETTPDIPGGDVKPDVPGVNPDQEKPSVPDIPDSPDENPKPDGGGIRPDDSSSEGGDNQQKLYSNVNEDILQHFARYVRLATYNEDNYFLNFDIIDRTDAYDDKTKTYTVRNVSTSTTKNFSEQGLHQGTTVSDMVDTYNEDHGFRHYNGWFDLNELFTISQDNQFVYCYDTSNMYHKGPYNPDKNPEENPDKDPGKDPEKDPGKYPDKESPDKIPPDKGGEGQEIAPEPNFDEENMEDAPILPNIPHVKGQMYYNIADASTCSEEVFNALNNYKYYNFNRGKYYAVEVANFIDNRVRTLLNKDENLYDLLFIEYRYDTKIHEYHIHVQYTIGGFTESFQANFINGKIDYFSYLNQHYEKVEKDKYNISERDYRFGYQEMPDKGGGHTHEDGTTDVYPLRIPDNAIFVDETTYQYTHLLKEIDAVLDAVNKGGNK